MAARVNMGHLPAKINALPGSRPGPPPSVPGEVNRFHADTVGGGADRADVPLQELVAWDERKAARGVRRDDVPVAQVALVDREQAADPGFDLVNGAAHRIGAPVEEGTGEHQVAAGAGAVAMTDPARQAPAHVGGTEMG